MYLVGIFVRPEGEVTRENLHHSFATIGLRGRVGLTNSE